MTDSAALKDLKNIHQLNKRIKELNSLYAISDFINRGDATLDEILLKTVQIIPAAFMNPSNIHARITLSGHVFKRSSFKKTDEMISSDIYVHGQPDGHVEVFFTDLENIDPNHASYLKEKQALINAIAERLGKATERKRAQAALKKSEKRFHDLVDNSLIGIMIIQNGWIVYENPEQKRLFGDDAHRLSFPNFDAIYENDRKKVMEFCEKMADKNEKNLETDFRFYPDVENKTLHDLKWVHCRATSIEYMEKEAILINVMDITQIKNMERLLTIQDKMASLGRVAAGIAHEIRNPLSGVNLYLSALKKNIAAGEGASRQIEIIDKALDTSRRIESVIKRTLDFSKPGEPQKKTIHIAGPIHEALNLISAELKKRQIAIETDIDPDLPECHADERLIEEVILNLMNNAADSMAHMEGKKQIAVSASVQNKKIVITVFDSGPGVKPEILERIFEPFYTTKSDSSGIGLSICRRIMADHDGSLNARPGKQGGVEFVMEIPLRHAF